MIGLAVGGTSYLRSTLPSKQGADTSAPPASLGIPISYDFVTPTLGWVLETAGSTPIPEFRLFRTDDGGKQWRQQFMKQGIGDQAACGQAALSDCAIAAGFVQFADSRRGFIGVMWPQLTEIYRTVDGGAHWAAHELPIPAVGFPSFSDSSHGWLFGLKQSIPAGVFDLYSTGDGAGSWQQMPGPPPDADLSMTFRGPAEGWFGAAAPEPPHVYSSGDGGRTWQRHDLPQRTGDVPGGLNIATAVRLLPGDGLFASVEFGSGGPPYGVTSFDKGTSWRFVTAPSSEERLPEVLSFQDALHWWAVDGPVLFKSTDAGQTWTEVSNAQPAGVDECQVLDSLHAWALVGGPESTGFSQTDDGGLHWSSVPIPHWQGA